MAAYLISDLTVLDSESFQTYRTRAAEAIAEYGGRYLVRGGEVQTLEGTWNPSNIVVAEFPSLEEARDGISLGSTHEPSKSMTAHSAAISFL